MTELAVRGLSALLALPLFSTPAVFAQAQAPARPKTTATPQTLEDTILGNLAADPVTAPYKFGVGRKDGRLILAGRVGTKVVHDTAIRIALATTTSIDDSLVIDTAFVVPATTNRVAMVATNFTGPGYVYPPPLFGRLDDPFWGFEPPVISYPPWWAAVAARRGDPYAAPVLDPFSPIGPDPGPANPNGAKPAFPSPITATQAGRSVEMTLDPRGVGLLRGTVGSEETRVAIGQKAAKLPGVREIINQIEVDPAVGDDAQPIRAQDQPPPPPVPAQPPAAAVANAPVAMERLPKVIPPGEDADSPDRRLARAIERRPILGKLGVKTEVKDGIASLSGKVPTALEAMQAFRAAQQTVGVRDVVDRLEFAVPDGLKPNPLIASGRPDDVEPYLEAQIRRQVGDRAHIDRVRVSGDRLELRGTVTRETDRPGVEAILRSMPLLRGFTIDSRLIAN